MKKPKKMRPMRLLVTAILFAAVLFATVVFIAFRDEINSGTVESFLNFFRWNGKEQESESFRYDPGRDNRFVVCDGRLAVLSPERFSFHDKSGIEKYSRSLSYKTPALCGAGSKVIAYDRSGSGCFVAGERSVQLELDIPVLAAAGNDRGQFVLVTKESGYRSVARLYNRQNNPQYIWRSSRYIMAAGLSPLGNRMAVASIGQDGDLTGTKVTFLEVGNETPLQEITLLDTLPWGIYYPDNSHVCIITESLVYFYTVEGEPLGEYSWEGEKFFSYAASSEALFLHLGRYSSGQYSRVVCLGYEGKVLDTVQTGEGLENLSCAGKFVSLLTPDGLTRYTITPDGLQNPTAITTEAIGMCQQENGRVLLLFQDYAAWEMS